MSDQPPAGSESTVPVRPLSRGRDVFVVVIRDVDVVEGIAQLAWASRGSSEVHVQNARYVLAGRPLVFRYLRPRPTTMQSILGIRFAIPRQWLIRCHPMQPKRVLEQGDLRSGQSCPGRLAHRRTADSILLVMARSLPGPSRRHKPFAGHGPCHTPTPNQQAPPVGSVRRITIRRPGRQSPPAHHALGGGHPRPPPRRRRHARALRSPPTSGSGPPMRPGQARSVTRADASAAGSAPRAPGAADPPAGRRVCVRPGLQDRLSVVGEKVGASSRKKGEQLCPEARTTSITLLLCWMPVRPCRT